MAITEEEIKDSLHNYDVIVIDEELSSKEFERVLSKTQLQAVIHCHRSIESTVNFIDGLVPDKILKYLNV